MKYNFIMRNKAGGRNILTYDTERNELCHQGKSVKPEPAPKMDLGRYGHGLTVRLIMGKRCNFSCAYCAQSTNRKEDPEQITGISPEKLVDGLLDYSERSGKKLGQVQFWGGETLLYFKKMKKIHAAFLARMAEPPVFFYSTNGSLFKGERFRWTVENKIIVGFSWDGPGQHIRGKDVLQDPEIAANVNYMLDNHPELISISPVLSKAAISHAAVIEAAKKALGREDFRLNESALIIASDKESMDAALPAEDLPGFCRNLHTDLISRNIPQFTMAQMYAMAFLHDLGKPVAVEYTRCFVGSGQTRAVDTEGNIITCQNFSANAVHESGEPYCMGNIFNPEAEKQPPLKTLKARRAGKCAQCAVVAVCRGGCPYWNKEYAGYNCAANYYQYMPVLGLALHMLTGDVLEEIVPVGEGE